MSITEHAQPKRRTGRMSLHELGGTTRVDELPPPSTATSATLDELVANPHNPRDGYQGQTLDELAASMAEVGQLQPLAVVGRDVWLSHYPDESDALRSARWVVLTGCRRLAAAPAAGLKRMDIVVKDRLAGADPRLSEATLIENLHREALPPLLEARELATLVERHGSQRQVAKRVGKTQAWVSQRLSLLNLTPELTELLRRGEITVKEARTVALRPADEQTEALEGLREPIPAAASSAEQNKTASPRRARGAAAPTALPDVTDVARDLRAKYSPKDLTRLVQLLSE